MKSRGSLEPAGFGALKWVAKFGRFNAKNRMSTVKIDEPAKLLQSDTGSNQSDYEGVTMATAIINAAPRLQWFELRFTEDPRKIRCDCLVCKKPMWFPKSKAGKYVTCGGVCAQKRFEEMALWRVRVCGVCGSTFIPRKTQLDAGKGVTCSQKCNAATNSALNSAESHAKSKLAWKQRNAASPIFKSGVENPCWTGGKAASYQRLRESGRTRIYLS